MIRKLLKKGDTFKHELSSDNTFIMTTDDHFVIQDRWSLKYPISDFIYSVIPITLGGRKVFRIATNKVTKEVIVEYSSDGENFIFDYIKGNVPEIKTEYVPLVFENEPLDWDIVVVDKKEFLKRNWDDTCIKFLKTTGYSLVASEGSFVQNWSDPNNPNGDVRVLARDWYSEDKSIRVKGTDYYVEEAETTSLDWRPVDVIPHKGWEYK